MLPCFVSRSLAVRALLVGKAINFIRLCCNDPAWSVATAPREHVPCANVQPRRGAGATPECCLGAVRSQVASTASGSADSPTAGPPPQNTACHVAYGQEERLASLVGWAATRAHSRLLDLMLGRFKLRAHCYNLKQFMLLGKGDFVQHMMENLTPQLSRPSSQLHRHHLLSLVEAAVRSSAAGGACSDTPVEGEPFLLMQHLDVQLSKIPGSNGAGPAPTRGQHRTHMPAADCGAVPLQPDTRRRAGRVGCVLARLPGRGAGERHLLRAGDGLLPAGLQLPLAPQEGRALADRCLAEAWHRLPTAEGGTSPRLLDVAKAPRSLVLCSSVQVLSRDVTLHRCHLLRNEMIHFVSNLQYYLMFEVARAVSSRVTAPPPEPAPCR